MNEWAALREGIRYAPVFGIAIAGILAIVVMFLKHLEKKETLLQEDFDKRDKTITTIASQAFEIHKSSNEIIKENTQIIGEIKGALEKCRVRQYAQEHR